MPLYEDDDDEVPAPVGAVDFTALLAEAPTPLQAAAFAPPRAADRTNLEIGHAVSRCGICGEERWLGVGPCSNCDRIEREGSAFPPDPVIDALTGAGFVRTDDLASGVPAFRLGGAPPPSAWYERPEYQAASTPDLEATKADLAPPISADDDSAFANQLIEALDRLSPQSGQALAPHQLPPPIYMDPDSTTTGWVMLAGRNAGKTYAGARELHRYMLSNPGCRARIIAPSFGDAVASCIEGPSGILSASNYQVQWKPAHAGGAQLVWPNGGVCYVIGTPTPRDVDRLRAIGNVSFDWFEEAAANPQIVEAERQARLSRRTKGAKWIATTTPRPLKLIRDWKKDASIQISAATAHDNKHADPLWLEELERMYAGTRLYAQEVEGKVLEDVEGALWKLEHIERSRVKDIVEFYEYLMVTQQTIQRAAVGVDPANSTGTTGIVCTVMTNERRLFVVEDVSQQGLTSDQWAHKAVNLARQWDAVIVAENDSGGDAIRGVLKAADLMDDITIVPATARGRGGKTARAEPISLLWERDDFRGHIVGLMPHLEDQMTTYVQGITTESPDRMDAMVWACTYLWTQASFHDVTAEFPNLQANTGNASARRPGAMIRWHKGKTRERT